MITSNCLNLMKIALSISVVLSSLFVNIYSQCNGSNLLCNKKYNEVAYLTTHNAYNSNEDNFSLPNHNNNITAQLNDGVRALMIDVYDLFGTPSVYHGTSILGSAPFLDYLIDIKTFLDLNPNEVVTIILECYISSNDIENELIQAGLMNYLYAHAPSNSWPTLQTMISNNERLVIFSDVDDASATQTWYHYVWDYAVETHYTNHSQNDFSCDFNRGDSINDLFILNHFVTNSVLGTGDETQSAIVNANPFFINRVLQCEQEKNKFPNFITVDFYELGNCLDVVDQMNGIITSIDPEKTSQINTEKNQIIDVRKKSEYDLGKVKKAINICLSTINNHQDQFLSEDHKFIHCQGGYRSMIACSILKSRGIHNITNIRGGFKQIKNNQNIII